MKALFKVGVGVTSHAPLTNLEDFCIQRFELKYTCRDPKDSELCLHRVKSGESLMEARSGSNVQIDRQM